MVVPCAQVSLSNAPTTQRSLQPPEAFSGGPNWSSFGQLPPRREAFATTNVCRFESHRCLELASLVEAKQPLPGRPESSSTLLITQVVFMFPSLNTWIDVFVLLVKVRGIWRPWLFPSMRSWGDGGRDFVGFHPSNCSRLFHAHVVFSRPKTNAKPYQYYHGCYCYYGYYYHFIVMMILWLSL